MTLLSPLALLDATVRGALLACLLLLALVLHRDRGASPAARLGVALMLTLCVQVIGGLPLFEARVPYVWQVPWVAVSGANAVLFWLFVRALFDDDFQPRWHHLGLWLAAVGLSTLNCLAFAHGGLPVLVAVLSGLLRAVPVVFAVLAIMVTTQHWRVDLVEGRRHLRVFIVATGVAYTLLMMLLRLASPQGRLSASLATLDALLLLAIVAVAATRLLRLGNHDLFPETGGHGAAPVASPVLPGKLQRASPQPLLDPDAPQAECRGLAPEEPAELGLAQALAALMAQQHAYRDESLSVASLAARLGVPEYRLRRHINQRLGYRNFNAFVNGHRLADACAALANSAQRELPVLTIALDAGFASIGPFNRAFKTATGLTPTEYRREKLADS